MSPSPIPPLDPVAALEICYSLRQLPRHDDNTGDSPDVARPNAALIAVLD